MSGNVTVFIDGEAGTTGLRLKDRLEERGDVRLLSIHPELRKDTAERAKIANQADVVFLCLPDDAAREAVAGINNPATKVIDTSTAHRTLEGWAYGLPELSANHREAIKQSKRTAVPGCHAMGFVSLAYPLIAGGIVSPDYPMTCHSITGYSGAGKGVIADYQDQTRADYYAYPRQYAMGQSHKHLPEMKQIPGLQFPPVFSPIICDFYAGMVVTVPLHARLMDKCGDARALHGYFSEFYTDQKMISVMPFGAEEALRGGMMNPGELAGRDSAEIFICGNGERIILMARFDNLGKGASGAAIQCMNLMCGMEETTGLCL